MTFIRILVLIGVGVCGWLIWRDWSRNSDKDYWQTRLRSALAPANFAKTRLPEEREASVWLVLAVAWEAAQANEGEEGFEIKSVLRDAAVNAGMNTHEAEAVADCVIENVTVCRRCGVTDDPAALAKMLAGQPPEIRNGIYTGEKLRLTPVVPATSAPEAAWHPGNLLAMPDPVAMFSSLRIPTERVMRTGQKLQDGGVISKATLEALRRARDEIARQR